MAPPITFHCPLPPAVLRFATMTARDIDETLAVNLSAVLSVRQKTTTDETTTGSSV